MSHSLRYDVNCSLLFTELAILERPAAVRQAGFAAVEFWWPFADAVPRSVDVDAFVRAIEDAGVALVGLNFYAGDMPGGDRGLVSWPARSSELRDNIEVTIGIGERLGCRAFNALYGNRVEGVGPEEQDELAVENLAFAARAAARIGGTVLIEPVSGAPPSGYTGWVGPEYKPPATPATASTGSRASAAGPPRQSGEPHDGHRLHRTRHHG